MTNNQEEHPMNKNPNRDEHRMEKSMKKTMTTWTRRVTTLGAIITMNLVLGAAEPPKVAAFDQPKVYDLKPNERVFIYGDSTTFDGTDVAGYVRLVDQAIQEQIPDRKAAVRSHAWPGVCLVPENHEKLPENWKPFSESTSWKGILTHPNTPTTLIINLGLNDSKQGEANVPTY
ncbi:MAG: hypothetical protein WCI20_13585, partial [bacterium]